MPQIDGFFEVFCVEEPNVPIRGYLFSMMLEQEGTRRREKPRWQVDVCLALPDEAWGGDAV